MLKIGRQMMSCGFSRGRRNAALSAIFAAEQRDSRAKLTSPEDFDSIHQLNFIYHTSIASRQRSRWSSHATMDIFKILTRSTNLQKNFHDAKPSPPQRIPSAGSQSYGLDEQRSSQQPQISPSREQLWRPDLKRKRGPNAVERRVQEEASCANDSKNGILEEAWEAETDSKRASKIDEDSAVGSKIIYKLSEEDCKKILWSHKLKITLLEDPQQVPVESRRDKLADKLAAPKSKKDTKHYLFPQPVLSLSQLRSRFRISPRLSENLSKQGYYAPTEVQMAALPLLLGAHEMKFSTSSERQSPSPSESGGEMVDLLTVAPTGSGKTLAFLIPTIHGLLRARHHRRSSENSNSVQRQVGAVILAPTHELAEQIANQGKCLTFGTGLKVAAMHKSMRIHDAIDGAMSSELVSSVSKASVVKADILVSTPLMLQHAIGDRLLPTVIYLILDEADVLLDPLFRSQTLAIWTMCSNPQLQVSLWSATIGASIETFAQSHILDRRKLLGLSSENRPMIRLIVGLKDSPLPSVSHRLLYAATEQGKLLGLRQLLHPAADESQVQGLRPPFLVFAQTITRAVALHAELLYDIPVEAGGSARIAVLHSELSDKARSEIMAGFRRGEIWVLITTDLLSRGIDFRGINGVVNYDIPTTSASYVHRAGRTGRAGRKGGIAVTLYTKEDIPYLKNIANVIAASQKGLGAKGLADDGLPPWLLHALPEVSKKTRKALKRRGVDARRNVGKGNEASKAHRRSRISTKSGYDRKQRHRRQGGAHGGVQRAEHDGVDEMYDADMSDGSWKGFDG